MVSVWQPALILFLVLLSLFIGLTFNPSTASLTFESVAALKEPSKALAAVSLPSLSPSSSSSQRPDGHHVRRNNTSIKGQNATGGPTLVGTPACLKASSGPSQPAQRVLQGWTTVRDVRSNDFNLTVLPAWGNAFSLNPPTPTGPCGDYSFAKAFGWSNPKAAVDVCTPTHPLGTAVRCYTKVRVDGFKQQMCDSQNIALDLPRLSTVVKQTVGPHQPGVIIGDCQRAGGWKDLWHRVGAGAFQNLEGLTPGPLECDFWVEHPVYLLMRYGVMSMYHSMEDIETIFSIFTALGLPLDTTQLVVVDHFEPGYTYTWQDLDLLFIRAFSRGRPIMHAEEFAKGRPVRRLCFRRAVWGASPANSMVSWHAGSPLACGRQELFPALARHLLASLVLVPFVDPELIRITFNLRNSEEHKDLRARARALPRVAVREVEFIHHTLRQQVAIAMDTDVMVGTHGAGMTLLLYMPGHGAVIELPRADRTGSCHYRNLASLAGLLYAEAGSALESIVQQVTQRRTAALPPALRNPGRWQHCSAEGQTCTLERRAMVRFGVGQSWSARMVEAGSLHCIPTSFAEDPKPLVPKSCQYWL